MILSYTIYSKSMILSAVLYYTARERYICNACVRARVLVCFYVFNDKMIDRDVKKKRYDNNDDILFS